MCLISSDDDDFLKSCHELRLGNIQNAQTKLRLAQDKSSSLASSLRKRLDITLELMVKARDSYNKKEWDGVLKHTKAAIKLGVDLCTELYIFRAQAYLASNLTEETVSELSNAILSLFKNHGGFKAPEKNEEEAAIDQANFDEAILNITQDKV